MINVSQKMREVLPSLKRGINDNPTPGLRPQREDAWNEGYATLKGLWYSAGPFDDQEYFNHERFKRDYEKMVRSHFPGCKVTFNWHSQEIEVYRQ